MSDSRLLKKDLFGEVWQRNCANESVIVRDTRSARWWLRWLANALMKREAKALIVLEGIDGIPQLREMREHELTRNFVAGNPMHVGKPTDRAYFVNALRLLRRMHQRGVVHNDLAKEPNLLIRNDGSAAFIDFQLAWYAPRRGRMFRMAAREDIRHLLKHKRTYRPADLSQRQLRILATPAAISRAYMSFVKPIYLFITRRLFGWADREGAGDRGRQG